MNRDVSRRLFLTRSAQVAAVASAAATLPAQAARAASAVPEVEVREAARLDPTEATIAEAHTLLRRGELTSQRLVRAHLERIDAFDGTYQAYNTVLREQALAQARAADRRGYPNALSGIPLMIKDNYFTKGVRTTANSFVFADFVPPYDATVVTRLKGQGGIVLGKGQMGPLATTRATTPDGRITTVNAWAPADPSVDPGGSSSGPATAVAGRLATSSIGTQTGGSITGPSNQQALTGLKPTMGRTSIHGVIPLSFTRDHAGPISRDALDAAIMLQAMAGPDPEDVRTLGLPPVGDYVRAATPVARGTRVRRATRVGVPPDYLVGLTPEALALRQDFLAALRGVRGITVLDVAYPDDWTLLTTTFNAVRLPERTEPFRPYLQQDLKLFGVSVLGWLQGFLLSGDEWVTGQRAKQHLLEEVFAGPLDRCDVLLQTSPVPFDILGLPEIALPIGFTAGTTAGVTLPAGTILGAGPYEEERLLEVAAAYQAGTDWHLRRPADPAPAAASLRAAGPELRLDAASALEASQ